MTGPETSASSAAVRSALGLIDPGPLDLVVVLSPHGPRTGVYPPDAVGTLAPFGYPDVGAQITGDAGAASALADAWGAPLLDEAVDYGVFVPLILWEVEDEDAKQTTVIAASIDESATSDRDALSFVDAITGVTDGRRTLFVASANGSAGLSSRAPLTEIEGAAELEDAFLKSLGSDAADVEPVARELASRGGSCGLGPLVAFSRLFAGRRSRVLAHERPVGVGYTVAVTDD